MAQQPALDATTALTDSGRITAAHRRNLCNSGINDCLRNFTTQLLQINAIHQAKLESANQPDHQRLNQLYAEQIRQLNTEFKECEAKNQEYLEQQDRTVLKIVGGMLGGLALLGWLTKP